MKYIDLSSSIRESNSALLKNLPAFVVRILEKIIHQDEMNTILDRMKDCPAVDFPSRALRDELHIRMEVEGLENLPENSKIFLVANHPFGMVEGLMLISLTLEKYKDLRTISNDALMIIPNLRPLIAKVNVFGRTGRETLIELEKVYRSDSPIVHFPAGEVSRKYDGHTIRDTVWQKSFISKAISCERDIVPIFFHGRNSKLFHGLYRFRKFLGIGANLELALLPREMFNKKGRVMKVTIGKPVSWKQLSPEHSHAEWAAKLKEFVYSLEAPGGSQKEFIP